MALSAPLREHLPFSGSYHMMFRDRKDSGAQLAERLLGYSGRKDVVVLGLPRGGVVTAREVALKLHASLDVLIVRKLGFPGQQELAIGAVAETGAIVLNEDLIASGRVSQAYIDEETERQKGEIGRRVHLYRAGKALTGLKGKIVILVDDGVATGATAKAAIEALKREKPQRLVAAIPVAPPSTAADIETMVDEFVCLAIPENFLAVGSFYRDFRQTTDEEVMEILGRSGAAQAKIS